MHSGADLESAGNAVLGYNQVSMKGKAIKVDPVPGVATAHLKTLLEAALVKGGKEARGADQPGLTGVAQSLEEVERLMAVRRHLLPALAKGNDSCGGRLRYELYNRKKELQRDIKIKIP